MTMTLTERRVLPGEPAPLGATWDGQGANFALFSEEATAVELCLFDEDGQEECVPLREVTAHVWHAYLPGIEPGQRYGYRVDGPYEPAAGRRFNRRKLLLDPYAKAVVGGVDWSAPVFGYQLHHPEADLSFDDQDDAGSVPLGVVIDPSFDWEDDAPPRTPWHRTIIYEAHVKGVTMRHPGVPPEARGTYAGLASEAAIRHLIDLGITAIELLPIHEFPDDGFLVERGLRNYWGYNTLNYFAPAARYSGSGALGGQVTEFKRMVKALHRAGIEVILDVVYNHTAEGNERGPTLSLRGIDNRAYYRLVPGQERYYLDYTGTGNSLNMNHPQSLQLIMDSLRYWVTEMHVDGFRFDLAATLARELFDVDKLSAFFDIIHQDPVLSRVKLIAEPWDVGVGGYQVGNFPVLWSEWNGKYRDSVRGYWKGDEGQMADLGYRLSGSSDLYGGDGRRPHASVNFITAHDGFTLADLVSYNEKHNEANGEEGRDGADDNRSWNCGVEGPTDDPAVLALRARQQRNLLATLFLSQGVPMLCGGDEIGRTQGGNNNAYCQDNEISWHDWELDERRLALLGFTRRLIALRKAHPVLRRQRFFQGRPIRGAEIADITWFRPDGQEMNDSEWNAGWGKALAVRLNGAALDEVDEQGERIVDDTLLLLLNAHHEPIRFTLPMDQPNVGWEVLVDTGEPGLPEDARYLHGGAEHALGERSLILFRACRLPDRPDTGHMPGIARASKAGAGATQASPAAAGGRLRAGKAVASGRRSPQKGQ
jgi:glycogen operon protein